MNLRRTECRSCGAPIVWARSVTTGRALPVDADPTPTGNLRLTPGHDGRPRAEVTGPPSLLDTEDGDRYVSHFATCPNADDHRTRR